MNNINNIPVNLLNHTLDISKEYYQVVQNNDLDCNFKCNLMDDQGQSALFDWNIKLNVNSVTKVKCHFHYQESHGEITYAFNVYYKKSDHYSHSDIQALDSQDQMELNVDIQSDKSCNDISAIASRLYTSLETGTESYCDALKKDVLEQSHQFLLSVQEQLGASSEPPEKLCDQHSIQTQVSYPITVMENGNFHTQQYSSQLNFTIKYQFSPQNAQEVEA